jgi:RimJ/RimL family protein N-acetyltransferase
MNIRLLTRSDAPAYWSLRLKALKQYPLSFASNYEDSAELPFEQVLLQFSNAQDDFIVGALDDNHHLIGMMGLHREQKTKLRHKAMLWGVYVVPELQGNGIARLLLAEVIQRAKQISGLEQIQLSVVTTNTAAKHLYESLGFQTYGTESHALKYKGQYVDEAHMVLNLVGED